MIEATTKITQKQFEDELLTMLLEDMQPMAIVERTGFTTFVKRLLPYLRLPSRRTLGRRINDLYDVEKKYLIDELKLVQYVSVTIDLWSSHKRGFMGITLHYVKVDTLRLVSHALGCRRLKNSHTGDHVAEMMAKIFNEYGITSKITCCVTDNAANMVKALRLFDDSCNANRYWKRIRW
jgi:hypothetical protein